MNRLRNLGSYLFVITGAKRPVAVRPCLFAVIFRRLVLAVGRGRMLHLGIGLVLVILPTLFAGGDRRELWLRRRCHDRETPLAHERHDDFVGRAGEIGLLAPVEHRDCEVGPFWRSDRKVGKFGDRGVADQGLRVETTELQSGMRIEPVRQQIARAHHDLSPAAVHLVDQRVERAIIHIAVHQAPEVDLPFTCRPLDPGWPTILSKRACKSASAGF